MLQILAGAEPCKWRKLADFPDMDTNKDLDTDAEIVEITDTDMDTEKI
jgi:hypothetical protein